MANEQQICYISFHTACLGNLADPFPLPQAGGGSETVDTSEEEQNSWSASDQEVPHLGWWDGMETIWRYIWDHFCWWFSRNGYINTVYI